MLLLLQAALHLSRAYVKVEQHQPMSAAASIVLDVLLAFLRAAAAFEPEQAAGPAAAALPGLLRDQVGRAHLWQQLPSIMATATGQLAAFTAWDDRASFPAGLVQHANRLLLLFTSLCCLMPCSLSQQDKAHRLLATAGAAPSVLRLMLASMRAAGGFVQLQQTRPLLLPVARVSAIARLLHSCFVAFESLAACVLACAEDGERVAAHALVQPLLRLPEFMECTALVSSVAVMAAQADAAASSSSDRCHAAALADAVDAFKQGHAILAALPRQHSRLLDLLGVPGIAAAWAAAMVQNRSASVTVHMCAQLYVAGVLHWQQEMVARTATTAAAAQDKEEEVLELVPVVLLACGAAV